MRETNFTLHRLLRKKEPHLERLEEYRSEVISNCEELGHELRRIQEGTNTACPATVDSIMRTCSRLVALNRRMAADK